MFRADGSYKQQVIHILCYKTYKRLECFYDLPASKTYMLIFFNLIYYASFFSVRPV